MQGLNTSPTECVRGPASHPQSGANPYERTPHVISSGRSVSCSEQHVAALFSQYDVLTIVGYIGFPHRCILSVMEPFPVGGRVYRLALNIRMNTNKPCPLTVHSNGGSDRESPRGPFRFCSRDYYISVHSRSFSGGDVSQNRTRLVCRFVISSRSSRRVRTSMHLTKLG